MKNIPPLSRSAVLTTTGGVTHGAAGQKVRGEVGAEIGRLLGDKLETKESHPCKKADELQTLSVTAPNPPSNC